VYFLYKAGKNLKISRSISLLKTLIEALVLVKDRKGIFFSRFLEKKKFGKKFLLGIYAGDQKRSEVSVSGKFLIKFGIPD